MGVITSFEGCFVFVHFFFLMPLYFYLFLFRVFAFRFPLLLLIYEWHIPMLVQWLKLTKYFFDFTSTTVSWRLVQRSFCCLFCHTTVGLCPYMYACSWTRDWIFVFYEIKRLIWRDVCVTLPVLCKPYIWGTTPLANEICLVEVTAFERTWED